MPVLADNLEERVRRLLRDREARSACLPSPRGDLVGRGEGRVLARLELPEQSSRARNSSRLSSWCRPRSSSWCSTRRSSRSCPSSRPSCSAQRSRSSSGRCGAAAGRQRAPPAASRAGEPGDRPPRARKLVVLQDHDHTSVVSARTRPLMARCHDASRRGTAPRKELPRWTRRRATTLQRHRQLCRRAFRRRSTWPSGDGRRSRASSAPDGAGSPR